MKQILFYGYVYDSSVVKFLESLDEAKQNGEDAHLKINSGGGSVYSGWGMIKEWRDFPNKKAVTVHGNASSMASVFLLFTENTECIPQSKFTLHRASMYYEDESNFAGLESTNADFRKAMEEKLDIPKFEKLAGVTLDRFFDVRQPVIDVELDAKNAKSIGLIKKIVPLTSKEAEAINEEMILACSDKGFKLIEVTPEAKKDHKKKTMTLEELQKDHPQIAAQIVANASPDIIAAAIKKEQIRVKAWMAYNEIDPDAVKTGIEGGEEITSADMAEFQVKGMKNGFIAKAGSDGKPPKTEEPEGGEDGDDPEAKKVQEHMAEVRENLGLTKKD